MTNLHLVYKHDEAVENSHYLLINDSGECVAYGSIDVIEHILEGLKAKMVNELEYYI